MEGFPFLLLFNKFPFGAFIIFNLKLIDRITATIKVSPIE
jgi:hypothetical protein